MLDSNPVKVLHLIATVLTIASAIGGGFVGVELKGDTWGNVLAGTVFMLGFALASMILLLVVLLGYALVGRMRRECPVCRGRGTVQTGFNEIMQPSNSICPKCHGSALIW
ncbi:MAG: zinc finger-like domain-containing protein [Planctomycetaceae bacterium]|nr:zinc finger-like domain-containing protein [Planctomycetaceae bacterium]